MAKLILPKALNGLANKPAYGEKAPENGAPNKPAFDKVNFGKVWAGADAPWVWIWATWDWKAATVDWLGKTWLTTY